MNTKVIGLYTQDQEKSYRYWKKSVDYLNTISSTQNFKLTRYPSLPALAQAIEKKQLDLLIVDPISFAKLQYRFDISAIASHMERRLGYLLAYQSIVFFTRASHKEIYKLTDLSGKRYLAFGINNTASWWIQLEPLKRVGLDPYSDLKLLASERIQNNIVFDVISGQYDAGVVQSGVLEQLVQAKKIDFKQIRILNPVNHANFPFKASTRLFPGWVFAKTGRLDATLSIRITKALFDYADKHPNDPMAYGWTSAQNYLPAHRLLQSLQKPPYSDYNLITFAKLFYRYWALFLLLLIVALAAIWLAWRNRQITRALIDNENKLKASRITLNAIAAHDSLTGLSSRRDLDETLAQEWWRACREQTPMSAIIIDIDNFKQFNHKLGHKVGDTCLVKVSECIETIFKRSIDIKARYGDDEFLMILPSTDAETCLKLADQLHQLISEIKLDTSHGTVTISASIGIATQIPKQDSVPDALIAAADAALFNCKNNDRGNVSAQA